MYQWVFQGWFIKCIEIKVLQKKIILVTLLSGVTHVTSKREGVFSARNAIPEDETVVRVAQSRRPLTNDAAWLGNWKEYRAGRPIYRKFLQIMFWKLPRTMSFPVVVQSGVPVPRSGFYMKLTSLVTANLAVKIHVCIILCDMPDWYDEFPLWNKERSHFWMHSSIRSFIHIVWIHLV